MSGALERRKASFAPIKRRRPRTIKPHSPTVGIAVCGQSNSEQERSFTHSQVGQPHAARVRHCTETDTGSYILGLQFLYDKN